MAHPLIAFPTPVPRWAIGTQTSWGTVAGDIIDFANERSLLSVAILVQMVDRWFTEFPARVYNLLRMIGVPTDIALQECAELETVVLARTKSRGVLGSLNEIAPHYQPVAKCDSVRGTLSLSAVEPPKMVVEFCTTVRSLTRSKRTTWRNRAHPNRDPRRWLCGDRIGGFFFPGCL